MNQAQIVIKTRSRRRTRPPSRIEKLVCSRRFQRIFTAWLIASGGAAGIMLAAIILNWYEPGHPVYLIVRFLVTKGLGL